MLQMSDTEWNERGGRVNTVDDVGGSNNEKNEVNSFTNYSAKNEKGLYSLNKLMDKFKQINIKN